MSYILFTSLFLVSLALAVRPFLVRRAAHWPAEVPDTRDDVARAVSSLRDLEFARAAGTIAPEDHARLRALLERSAFTRAGEERATAAPWRTLLVAALFAGVAAVLVVASLPQVAGDRAPGEPITGTVPQGPTLADLQRQAAADPTDIPTQLALGDAYLESSDLNGAATAYQAVLKLDGQNVSALNGLAIVLFRAGETNGANLALDRVLQLRPKDPDALFLKGLLQYQTGDFNGAVATWTVFLDVGQYDGRAAMVRPMYEDAKQKAGK
ncbi:MAG TPA: tetratricopeptide repeat protein [Candidatus Limnocylindria bacterium]